MRPYRSLFILTLLGWFVMNCRVDGQTITFNNVAPPNGKTFIHITGITQDLNGYMWFSSKNGIFRYDGYQMINYKNNPLDPNSLASNYLDAICADSTGIIWVGTMGAGLDRFDPSTGIFNHYRPQPKNPGSIQWDYVTALFVDHEGILWVATDEGLDRFDSQNDQFSHFNHLPGDSTSISSNEIRTIYEDKKGTLWIGTGSVYSPKAGDPHEGGLNRFDRKTGTFTRYKHNPKNPYSLINNKVQAIFEDSNGNFWVGTAGDGLHTMDRATGRFVRHQYDPAHSKKLSRPPLNKASGIIDFITFIIEDATGAIWIGTSASGIHHYNPQSNSIRHFESNKEREVSLMDWTSWCAYTSREGVIWIGTIGGKLFRIDPFQMKIPYYEVSGGPVNSFYEEPNGTLWIGTGTELIRNDRATGVIKRYQPGLHPSKEYVNALNLMIGNRQGNIWIGGNDGLYLWNTGKKNFIHYKYDPKNSNSLSHNNVYAMDENNESNLWIGTAKGFNFLDINSGLFTRYFIYPGDTTAFGENTITAIHEDKAGQLWVGAYFGGGVNLFNKETREVRSFIQSTIVACIYEDSGGTLWVGANDGLYRFDHKEDNFVPYEVSNSLIGISDVQSMVEDDQKYLWLGTTNGIVKINPQRNETTFYGNKYGVNEVGYQSIYLGRQGELYFGDATGYFKFFPNELTHNNKPPEILFTNFLLADQVVKPGSDSPLKEALSKVKEIALPYNQNVFSFEFSAIDYSDPEGNLHYHMLENYDNSWHQSNSDRRATYFDIPPGEYVFRVKAANSYGVWAEKQIDIILLPPWWRTWWAYALYGILVITAVFAFDGFQRRRIVLMERQRTQKRELAQAKEIEKAYTELKATQAQLIQSEKMASLGELTAGIAHEIQNPLNFVNNFSEVSNELIDEMNGELDKGTIDEAKVIASELKQNLVKILHHGKRAEGIVKGMLQHSRSSSGVKEPTELNKLADEYFRLAYHGLRAKDKSFNVTMMTEFDPSIGTITIIAQDIGRVILNLITNAFYAVTEKKKQQPIGYEPTVTVSTKKVDDKVVISVKDNGNGIPNSILDKVFQPFFTTKPTGQGTGLGLSMSYDIIKAHGGELKVETKEGEGSEFTIYLPVTT